MTEQRVFNFEENTFKAGVEATLALIEKLDTNNVGMVHPVTIAQAKRVRQELLNE